MSIHVRTNASGTPVYDVRLRTPDGRLYKRTFRTRKETDTFQAREKADRSRGGWVDPRAGQLHLAQYAARWLTQRPALRPRTVELYESLLRRHILPDLGKVELSALTTAAVRAWHAGLLVEARPGPSTVAKCYRLLRAILSTAVEDELIVKNPCILKGAGVERPEERPVATLAQVHALAETVVSAIGHGGNQRNHADPGGLLREAAELLRFERLPSNGPVALRRQAAELRAATSQALALEAAAAELLDAEYDAGVVRRRLERAEGSYRRRADLEARRAAGGLYAGERRSPNRPTHVEVDDHAWSTLKAHAAHRGRAVGAVVGDLVARAADAGVPAERDSERRSEHRSSDGRRAGRGRYARLFLPDDDTWFRFRAQAVAAPVSIARAVGLVVEQEARRLGWRPGAER